ncbi:phosphotransferase family protein [Beauveria brongniartii RCEF 3172]|uniref:Phosphotransferase family protein n=1 Tax=Beauveria brongniartii RCEF 3172 TaxID=1081107 RepID=A0A167GL70_9HYPO|nr:phosphotransferase family protein [Beauveria brongniartii RCEF 3172]
MFSIEGDDDAWDESDRLDKEWCESLLKPDMQQVIASFVAKHRQGIPPEVSALGAGGLNASLRVQFLDGASAAYWPDGLADWTKKYERRLKNFLKAMTETEGAGIAAGQLREDQRLSGRMRESWDSGEFWTVCAARKSFGFDNVYWAKLDHRFFGRTMESWRMHGCIGWGCWMSKQERVWSLS